MANLILLIGVPGCGKSTWAKTFFDLHYAVVSSDEIRKELAGSLREAHQEKVKPWDLFYDRIEDRLKHNVDTIADATFLTKGHRLRAREVADRCNADCHVVLFKNWHVATLRNEERDEDAKVPDYVMDDMHRLYMDTLAQLVQEDYATVTKIEAFD